jgi:hypothetical protein
MPVSSNMADPDHDLRGTHLRPECPTGARTHARPCDGKQANRRGGAQKVTSISIDRAATLDEDVVED